MNAPTTGALRADYRFRSGAISALALFAVGVLFALLHVSIGTGPVIVVFLAIAAWTSQVTLKYIEFRHRSVPPTQAEQDQARLAAYLRVRDEMAKVGGTASDFNTALFLLDESKARYERVSSDVAKLEGKAATLLTIVAGASGALGIFGLTKDGKTLVATPSIEWGAGAAVIGLFSLLYVLRAKTYIIPDADVYVSAPMMENDKRVGLALVLAPTYAAAAADVARVSRWDPIGLVTAVLAIATASSLVLLSLISGSRAAPAAGASPSPTPTGSRATRQANLPGHAGVLRIAFRSPGSLGTAEGALKGTNSSL